MEQKDAVDIIARIDSMTLSLRQAYAKGALSARDSLNPYIKFAQGKLEAYAEVVEMLKGLTCQKSE